VDIVRATGQEFEILIYNHPTGVSLTAHGQKPQRMVKGSVLSQLANPISSQNTSQLVNEIEELRNDDFLELTDPWAG